MKVKGEFELASDSRLFVLLCPMFQKLLGQQYKRAPECVLELSMLDRVVAKAGSCTYVTYLFIGSTKCKQIGTVI